MAEGRARRRGRFSRGAPCLHGGQVVVPGRPVHRPPAVLGAGARVGRERGGGRQGRSRRARGALATKLHDCLNHPCISSIHDTWHVHVPYYIHHRTVTWGALATGMKRPSAHGTAGSDTCRVRPTAIPTQGAPRRTLSAASTLAPAASSALRGIRAPGIAAADASPAPPSASTIHNTPQDLDVAAPLPASPANHPHPQPPPPPTTLTWPPPSAGSGLRRSAASRPPGCGPPAPRPSAGRRNGGALQAAGSPAHHEPA